MKDYEIEFEWGGGVDDFDPNDYQPFDDLDSLMLTPEEEAKAFNVQLEPISEEEITKYFNT